MSDDSEEIPYAENHPKITSSTSVTVLRNIFRKYDTNHDGYISTSELVELCYEEMEFDTDRSEACAYLLDRKGDNLISFDELNDWIKSGEHLHNIQDDSKFSPLKDSVDMFRKYDIDSSHAIDREEFEELFCDVGGHPSNLDEALDELDKDGNKKISFEEFLRWLKWVDLDDFISPTQKKQKKISPFTPTTILRSIFLKYDTNYDGYISTSELVELCLEDMGFDENRSEACAYLLDRKGDNLISFEELNDWIKSGDHLHNIQDDSKFSPLKDSVDMFRKYDIDSSHAIDREEFEDLFCDVGGHPSNLDEALQELDKDGNKKISFEEFLRWLKWVDLDDFISPIRFEEKNTLNNSFISVTVLQSIFAKYDTNHDGYISTSELIKLCYEDVGLDADRSEACAYLLDRKGDNLISFEELNDWMKCGKHIQNIQDDSKFSTLKDSVDMFRKYDIDSSHAIDRKEFEKLFCDVGGHPSNLDEALEELDKDGNKVISFEEFLRWLKWVDIDDFL